jgi:membrane protein required for colicin V production
MTALDILVLLLVGGLGLRGFATGFVTEVLSLIAWAVAIIAVKLLHSPVSSMLEEPVGTTAGASVLAFALTFGLPFLGGRFMASHLGGKSKQSGIGPIDRVLGLGFGAIKGLIGATLVYLFASLIYDTIYGGKADRPAWMEESRTYPLLDASARALVDFVDDRRKNGGDDAAESGA